MVAAGLPPVRTRFFAPLVLAAFAPAAMADTASLVTFSPPHTAARSSAPLDAALSARVQRRIAATPPTTTEQTIALALEATAAQLHFGLAHPTRLAFSEPEREGNCIEYAQLFASIFDRAAGQRGARAYAVHSADARLMGQVMAGRGIGEHDWALVKDGDKLYFVDPTFFDMGLPWDISK